MNAQQHQYRPVTFIAPELDIGCTECGGVIPAGERFIGQGRTTRHEVCPRPWTPTLILGDRAADPEQLTLSLIASVPQDDATLTLLAEQSTNEPETAS